MTEKDAHLKKKHLDPCHAVLGAAVIVFAAALVLPVLFVITIGAVKVTIGEACRIVLCNTM